VLQSILQEIEPTVLEIFSTLHVHPEVSWQEAETTKYITKFLQQHGCEVHTFDDCTGAVGIMGSGSPTVAIRADIDALWQEVEGTFQPNHSCGHDAHMAMVLGILLTLQKIPSLPKGTIKFIFQPAEEKGTGAIKMVEKGIVDDVDYLYGVHLRPIQELRNGTAAPAIVHGAARFIEGKITGDDLHGARPHLGANAIEVGAALVQMLNGIHLDPMIPYSVKMTSFHAGGESANIIPGSATFTLDLRAQTNQAMKLLVTKVEEAVDSLNRRYDSETGLSTGAVVAGAEVNIEAQKIMAESITSVFGSEKVRDPIVTTGGDDFHFYTIKRPHLKATMLGLGCDLEPGLHHPNMRFNQAMLIKGTEILARTIVNTLEKGVGDDA
jgi:amidohydrolase